MGFILLLVIDSVSYFDFIEERKWKESKPDVQMQDEGKEERDPIPRECWLQD